jgi:hypothetical protein
VPAGVAGLVLDLTAKDPAARPASADEVAARAGRLRDALAGGATSQLTGEPGGRPPAAKPGAEPATLAGALVPITAPAHRPLLWDRMRPRRGVVVAAAGAAVVAGLAGWLLGGAFGGRPPQQPQPGAGAPSAAAAHTVAVNADALAGQQASVVSQQLRQLGLRPRVVGTVRDGRAPGTVISVQPSGQVRAGSVVTVTAALPPPGQGNGDGNGQGNNGGD